MNKETQETLVGKCIATREVFELYEAIKPDIKSLRKTGRDNLAGVRVNSNRLLATNGHYLLSTAKPDCINLDNLTVSCESKQSIDSKNGLPSLITYQNGNTDGGTVTAQTGEVFKTCDWEYPDCSKVLSDSFTPTVRITLNADYLLRMATFLSENGKDCAVTLEIESPMSPIRLTGTRPDSYGILMPMKDLK